MKHLAALLSLLVLVSAANADSFVYVKRTNYTPKTLGLPNWATNGTSVVMQSVTWFTNMEEGYEFGIKTNVVAAIETVGRTSKESGFGLGEILAGLILAILGAWAKWQGMQHKKLNTVLGQNIETYSEVLKAQPGGVELDSKTKFEIKSQQVKADVKKMAAVVAEEKVDSGDARRAADRVMA